MKEFIRKILMFCLPLLVALTAIFFISTNREFCYNYVKGDCDQRGKLLYKKIYEDPNKVDYLFVGSSKTWNDIDDGLLEELINKPGAHHYKLFNVGYCRFGRNLDYLFCKEFLKRNRLKKIFLEVRADESTTSHPIFPFLADGREVLEGTVALNGKVFSEVYDHLLMNINYFRCLSGIETAVPNKTQAFPHGYNNIENIIAPEKLDEVRQKENAEHESINTNSIGYSISKYYLKKIKELCEKKQIELVLIYLPSYASIGTKPAFLKTYSEMGKVIIGPDSIFNNKNYWKDVAHLNSFGATAYTKFLATQL
jgi:hypothetical protein